MGASMASGGDFDTMPDVDEFARRVEVAVDRLVASSKRRNAARERQWRRGLSLVASE